MKKFRKDACLTQKALAGMSGISFSMISKLESGEQANPSFETIKKISKALMVTPDQLLATPLTIEEQIDEYIEYKRGISKKAIEGSAKCGTLRDGERSVNSSRQADSERSVTFGQKTCSDMAPSAGICSDLNFRKKMQAINNMPLPQNVSASESWLAIARRPEMQKLLSVLKNASNDEINQVIRLVETFKGTGI
jgi:Predicted transcriptional regulators